MGEIVSLPPRPHHQITPPIKENEIQQDKLIESYQEAQRFYRARHWGKVISIFQQMQKDNLPYFDPDGLYRLARTELLKQEQQTRRLNNIYTQGVKYYQANDWFEAQKKFKEILRSHSSDRDLRIKAEQRLSKIQKQLAKEKNISMSLIAFFWLASSFLPVHIIGGIVSAIVIWWISQRTRRLEASQQGLKLFLFILIGVIVEVIIWLTLENLLENRFGDSIIPGLACILGIAISIRVMFWQIHR